MGKLRHREVTGRAGIRSQVSCLLTRRATHYAHLAPDREVLRTGPAANGASKVLACHGPVPLGLGKPMPSPPPPALP